MGWRYPNQRPSGDALIEALRQASVRHWAQRGIQVGDATVDVADDLRGPDSHGLSPIGRGYTDERRLVLDGNKVGQLLARARGRHRTVGDRRDAAERVGHAIAHELGHVGGIVEHTPSGLLSAQAGSDTVPWEVRKAVRSLIRAGEWDRRVRSRQRRGGVARGGGEDW